MTGPIRGQKVLDPLRIKLKTTEGHYVRIKNKTWSSVRAASARNC